MSPEPTFGECRKICSGLPDDWLTTVTIAFLGGPLQNPAPIGYEALLIIALADWLYHHQRQYLTESERLVVIAKVRPALAQLTQQYTSSDDSQAVDSLQIGFADMSILVCKAGDVLYNLKSGEDLKELALAPLMTFVLNVNGLWFSALHRLKELRRDAAACAVANQEIADAQADLERSGIICDNAPDHSG